MVEHFVENFKTRSEVIPVWKTFVNGIVRYLESIAKFLNIAIKVRHFVNRISFRVPIRILNGFARSLFHEMRFDSSVSFVSFENVEYGFVKTVDKSFYRNVSLVFELSKECVVIRNVRILI